MRRLLALMLASAALAGPALAAVPRLLTQQGRLLDGADLPVSGDLELTFTVYAFPSAPFQGEDSLFWTEKKTVKVSNGVYGVVLGDTASNPLPDSVFAAENRFLGVRIGAGAELTPRLRVTSVPFAIEAGNAATLGAKKPGDYWQKSDGVEAATLGGKGPGGYWQRTDAVDAATLGSLAPGAYWQKSDDVNAATLGGKDLSAFWLRADAVNASTLGGQAATAYWLKADAVNAATLGGKDATAYWLKSDAVIAATATTATTATNATRLGGVDAANYLRADVAVSAGQGLSFGAPATKPACGGGSGNGLVVRDAATGGLQACDGTRWVSLTGMPGLTRAAAMASCAALRDAGAVVSGRYWINPGGNLLQVWCEQELEGGGWAMVHNSIASGGTAAFWNIPYAQRFQTKGSPDIAENHYSGGLYKLGTTYMDVYEDLDGKEAVAFVATTTGINQTTMRFAAPALVKGDGGVYACHFAAGWSAPDYDGDDAPTSNCATSYGLVTQHYCACWSTNLGSDADTSGGSLADQGWGPHTSSNAALGLASDGSFYSRLRRISRFARW